MIRCFHHDQFIDWYVLWYFWWIMSIILNYFCLSAWFKGFWMLTEWNVHKTLKSIPFRGFFYVSMVTCLEFLHLFKSLNPLKLLKPYIPWHVTFSIDWSSNCHHACGWSHKNVHLQSTYWYCKINNKTYFFGKFRVILPHAYLIF